MKTPLYTIHTSLHAKMRPFSGWEMPIHYEGILSEHAHTREFTSIFDTCHMGEFDFSGATAEADLERLVTMNVGTIREGQCRYGHMLNDAGGVIDDLTVYRRGPRSWFVVVNAGTLQCDAKWIREHVSSGTVFSDSSGNRAKLDIQGPTAHEEVVSAVGHELPILRYFRFTDTTIANIPCTLSRTGYTGELGYEIYLDADRVVELWEILTKSGRIHPAGLGARDTLRLEVGYPLYGNELTSDQVPARATRDQFIDLSKEFIGKQAVQAELERGISRILVGLRLATKRAARKGDRIIYNSRDVGVITSGAISPSLGVAIAFAYVDAGLETPGQTLDIDGRGKRLTATVVPLPFYSKGTARKKIERSNLSY